LSDLKKGWNLEIAFGPEILIIAIAPIPAGEDIATMSSLISITKFSL
jgi:hypothetical protein